MADKILKDPAFKAVLPEGFKWACAGASYQIEGGYLADGKGLGTWDIALKDQDNGEVGCDSYNLWRDDIELLKKYGCNSYRFSVSWPRVIPLGGADDPVNEAGIAYYSNLVDALLEAGIEPCVTIFHWDSPYELEKRYNDWASEADLVRDFTRYSKVLFERLGDRVKFWITLNEPHIFTMFNSMIKKGWENKDRWPLAKTLLLAHAESVNLYRKEFQPTQKGTIGITLNCDWPEPIDDSEEAKYAAQIYLDRVMGLYADPIYLGHFPKNLDSETDAEVPTFTAEQWALIKGSSDFFGLNHYGSFYTTARRLKLEEANPREVAFGLVDRVFERDGKIIGFRGQNGHPHDVPWGFRKLLRYIDDRYTRASGIAIQITENGFSVPNEADMSIEDTVKDVPRQTYYAGYLKELFEASRDDGIKIGGYMAWSLLDNLEWLAGYTTRFGITAVDRREGKGFKRYPKDSAYMLRDIFAYSLKK